MSGTPEIQPGAQDVVMDEFDDGAEGTPSGPDGAGAPQASPAAPAGAAPPAAAAAPVSGMPELPELTRKDKTLKEVLDLLEGDFAPIIPDTVTDYYLAKNGFSTADTKIKRILALAAQKFVLDIAQDAYEYSRIRSALSVAEPAVCQPAADDGRRGASRVCRRPGRRRRLRRRWRRRRQRRARRLAGQDCVDDGGFE